MKTKDIENDLWINLILIGRFDVIEFLRKIESGKIRKVKVKETANFPDYIKAGIVNFIKIHNVEMMN